MKFFTNKKITQKIIIALVTVIVLNFSVPIQSQSAWFTEVAGDLLQELVLLLDAVGDIVMGALNKFMLGTDKIYGSAMLDQDDINLDNEQSSVYAKNGPGENDVKAEIPKDFEPDGLLWTDWKIPNFLYCPENIFSNKIAALDVNFINSHQYTGVEYNKDGEETEGSIDKKASAAGGQLGKIISSWYKAFRNIAIVGLLIVLLYLGIRIMISSTAVDKAKYKQNLYDWLVALCLVVVIHFIMAGIMMVTDSITIMLSESVNKSIYIKYDDVQFRTNLTGYVRFMTQSADFANCTAYTIIYLALVIYTCMFTFTYFKRFLYMAFFTMIAPLVALTYPIDKLRDGKAQAFDLWFKEYTMNAIIQPVHLILYTVFVGSAMDLAVGNPIYAIVAIGFLTPAEKFIKKMFGVESQTNSGGLGEIAGGALAMKGVSQLVGQLTKKQGKDGKKEVDSGEGNNVLINRGANSGYRTNPVDLIAGGSNPREQDTGIQDARAQDTRTQDTRIQDNDGSQTQGTEGERQTNTQDAGSINQNERTIQEEINNERARQEAMGIILPDSYWQDETARRYREIQEQQAREQQAQEQQAREQQAREQQARQQQIQEQAIVDGQQPLPDILEAGQESQSRWQAVKSEVKNAKDGVANSRFGKGTSAVLASGGRRLKRATIDKVSTPEARRKTAYKLAKSGLRTATKLGGMAAGATLVGTAAAAAGVATGDFSKGMSTAIGGMTLGASAGGSIGAKYGQKMVSEMDNIKQTYEEGAYTKDEIKKKRQQQFDREWKNKEDNYKYLRSQGLNSKDAKEFLNDPNTQKYLDAGITDIKLIHNASKLAKDKDYDIDHAVARAKLASEYSDGFSRTEQNAFRESITKQNSSITNEMASDLIDDIKEIKGLK